ncbi:MAG: hypothetical protein OHK0039_01740 [Bacteroidia bacterium]
MKRVLFFTIPVLASLTLFLGGCIQDKCEQTMTYLTYEPVYMSFEALRSAVAPEAPRALEQPGKLYFMNQFIFVSEVEEGIHVIDNSDPAQPENVAFIRVPGNHDIAIKGTTLYADSYTDLVLIDVANPTQAFEINRQNNVFPYGQHHPGLWADQAQGVAIDFVETEVTETVDCSGSAWGNPWRSNMFLMEDALAVSQFSSNSTLSGGMNGGGRSDVPTGIGGSMARFTIVGDYLYTLMPSELVSFQINSATSLIERSHTATNWNAETIFPLNGNLFIGTTDGMIIYSLANPSIPQMLSMFAHARACDPVVANETHAFVTLRDGTTCNNFTNQLDVVDISNINSPWLVRSYPMVNPHGLGLRGNTLFICDGAAGLKVYDISDVNAISNNQLAAFPGIHAFDVIPLFNILLMIGEDGLYQYDFSDLSNIRQISVIPVAVN